MRRGVEAALSSTEYARGLGICNMVTRRGKSWRQGAGNANVGGQGPICDSFGGSGVATPGNMDGDCCQAQVRDKRLFLAIFGCFGFGGQD